MKSINATTKIVFEFIYKGYPPTSLVKISDPLRLSSFFPSWEHTEYLSMNESESRG